jgi:PAS domain S-box-containing protein
MPLPADRERMDQVPNLPGARDLFDQLKSAQDQCREYNEILDVLPDIIYKIDPEGYFVFLSKSIEVLGYSPEDLIGKHFSVIVHPEDLPYVSRKAVLPKFKGKMTGGENAPKLFDERRTGGRVTKNLVVRLLPKTVVEGTQEIDRNAIPGEVSASGQYSSDGSAKSFEGSVGSFKEIKKESGHKDDFYGEIATFGKYDSDITKPNKIFEGTVGVIRDISERKKLEIKKAELEQQLFHSKKMQGIGELAGGVAHDFNNILGVISGYTEMIFRKFGKLDPQLEKYTTVILAAITQAADLTGKLLAFARKGKYKNVPLDIHEIIGDTIQLLKHSIDRKIEIIADLRAERSCISGDPNQLKNALINISINARDAMPNGGRLIFSSENILLKDTDGALKRKNVAEGEYLSLSISDTGCGMDEEVKERLFEPFFTTKGMGKGTGLGLACVYGIVESHKGLIDCESALGAGTVFRVRLPTISDIPQAKPSVAAARVPRQAGHGHIMLIDDEQMFLNVNEEMLVDNGYLVTAFLDGREAIAYYRNHFSKIDLVIVDMIMPRINGRECFHELKKINQEISVIISTGYSLENDKEILSQEGVVGFLQKPFDSDKLFTIVEKALQPG